MSKYIQLLQGSWVRILCVNFNIFSCWHPWETRFKSGFHSSFWDFIYGIWYWGMASSFWNHVIQISIRQVHFQDIYSQLWIIEIFTENIYFLYSNTYFWGTVLYLQYGFLYLILIRPKFAVCSQSKEHCYSDTIIILAVSGTSQTHCTTPERK